MSKLHDPDVNTSFIMQFGVGMSTKRNNPVKKYHYPDKRTKNNGRQRPHKGVMGKYKNKDDE